jgi:hypothetical protein
MLHPLANAIVAFGLIAVIAYIAAEISMNFGRIVAAILGDEL